jgi:hypothetical protein
MDPQEFTQASIAEWVATAATYLQGERDLYVRHGEPLTAHFRGILQPYFSQELLDNLKTIVLTGARIPPAPFYAAVRKMSGGTSPDFAHMASITYLDVIVFHHEIAPRALFRGARRANVGFAIRQIP